MFLNNYLFIKIQNELDFLNCLTELYLFCFVFRLITALDVEETFEYLAYFGYISPPEENQLTSVCGIHY